LFGVAAAALGPLAFVAALVAAATPFILTILAKALKDIGYLGPAALRVQ
jgi:hypothetical protein